jgi:hypothetical protein
MLAVMGISLVAATGGETDQPVEERSLPIELGVAGVGIAGFLAGVYLTAHGRKLNREAAEAAAPKTTIAPTVAPNSLGLAISGSF